MNKTVGHYAPWLLGTLLSGLIVLTLVPNGWSFVPLPVLLGLLVVTAYVAFAVFAHNRHLCERCIAALPLDASSAARRYGMRFRVAHLFEHKLLAAGYLLIVVGSSVLYTDPVGRYEWAAVQATLVYLLVVYVTHQRLQPWCPGCRQGGEDVATPITPMPISTAS
jgi:hypothetical protein